LHQALFHEEQNPLPGCCFSPFPLFTAALRKNSRKIFQKPLHFFFAFAILYKLLR